VNGQTAEASIDVNLLPLDAPQVQTFPILLGVLAAILAVGGVVGFEWLVRRRRGDPTPGARSAGNAAPDAPLAPSSLLIELEGRNPGQRWVVGSRDVLIGRKQETNDIPAAGRSASRQHAVIRVVGGQFTIINLNPDNITIVNGDPINGERSLSPGDEIRIGDSRFRFEM
jgi:hypothetical protein